MTMTALSVRRSITVDAPQERAFDTFANLSAWWPLDTHTTGAAPARASIIQPRTGGRWYEIDKNGAECEIGTVLAYEPPARLLLAWQLATCLGFAYDPSMQTEVEVRFVPESATRTRVELEHRGFEAYGANAEKGRDLYDGEGAWTAVLARYAEHLR